MKAFLLALVYERQIFGHQLVKFRVGLKKCKAAFLVNLSISTIFWSYRVSAIYRNNHEIIIGYSILFSYRLISILSKYRPALCAVVHTTCYSRNALIHSHNNDLDVRMCRVMCVLCLTATCRHYRCFELWIHESIMSLDFQESEQHWPETEKCFREYQNFHYGITLAYCMPYVIVSQPSTWYLLGCIHTIYTYVCIRRCCAICCEFASHSPTAFIYWAFLECAVSLS